MGDNGNENNNGNRGFEGINPPIVSATINVENFEFKPVMFQMINNNGLFGGMSSDDPLSHMCSFNQMCDNFKQRGMTADAFRLRLFPYTLQGKARDWFEYWPSITTWEESREKFLKRFFPPTRNENLRNVITSFRQMDGESLWEVWERWNNLLRKCPTHRLRDDVKLETFYQGLDAQTRMLVDTSARGALLTKSYDESVKILDRIATNNFQWPTVRVHASGSKGSTSDEARLAAQNDALAAELASIKSMMKNMMSSSGMKEKKFQQRPQNPPGFYQIPNQQVRPQGGAFHQTSGSSSKPAAPSSNQEMSPFKKAMMEFIIKQDQKTEAREKNQAIAMRNLKNQLGQLAQALNSREPRTLPSNTQNPSNGNDKRQCNAITLRSGKELTPKNHDLPATKDEQQSKKVNKEGPTSSSLSAGNQKKAQEKDAPTGATVAPTTLPFPPRENKSKVDDGQFKKFLEILSQLHINIPFVEALKQIPTYAMFMKDVLTKKRVFGEFEIVATTKSCTSIIQNKLPVKKDDPGSFVLPCRIGMLDKIGLCDLGASINVMPLSIFRTLGIGAARLTTISLQLGDRSVVYPEATVGALIDVKKGEVTLRVNDEKRTFNMFKAVKQPFNMEECSFVRVMDNLVNAEVAQLSKVTHDIEEIDEWKVKEDVRWVKEELDLKDRVTAPTLPSIEKAPDLELKQLPTHLKYAY
ncbi:unnamed protein product [Lactuca virosa]|uniref:Retrotransposon gag domain-containing protein n=1 Tax=Lactuca virosa TaxID=75947 RepID=A0AAU9MM27_9ASTR|nr:unnamed protein product [Lactuca virosa]